MVDGVEIPTVDQLGNARPATPSVGAVEYSSLSGITGNVKDVVRIWNSGNIVYATGLDKTATAKVYSSQSFGFGIADRRRCLFDRC